MRRERRHSFLRFRIAAGNVFEAFQRRAKCDRTLIAAFRIPESDPTAFRRDQTFDDFGVVSSVVCTRMLENLLDASVDLVQPLIGSN